ncbi:MAG TPA: branched-chain amino acid transporter [Peptococcaceae bacterium]|nr:branched-chain amino acid transporter [Peptococcaceae bacterium]
MGLATYIPRALPFVFLTESKMPSFLKRFLDNIPSAILGALIFPGVLYSAGEVYFGIIGGIVSLIMAFFELNLVLVVAGSIGAVYFAKLLLL